MQIAFDPAQLKSKRIEKRWSQEDLAAIAGLGVRTVQRAEATGRVSLETAKAFASAFEEDLSMLESKIETSAEYSRVPKSTWGTWIGIVSAMVGTVIGLNATIGAADLSIAEIAAYNEQTSGGLAYGAISAVAGLSAAIIGILIGKMRRA